MNRTICDEMESSGTLARYLGGTLAEDASAAFEDHFLTCERCQASIHAGVAMRASPAAFANRPFVRRAWYGAAAALAAASLATVLLWQGGARAGVRGFGQVEVAPIYLGSPVRAAEAPGVLLFDSGMVLYGAGRYPAAAEVLQRARAAGAHDATLDFFLGASHLLAGAPVLAERSFSAVITDGDNLYLGEAYFYRAKARLQRGDRAEAIADLKRAAASDGTAAAAARELLMQLEA